MKSKFKVLLLYVALFAVIFFAVSVLFGGNSDAKEYEYSEIKGYFDEHRVTDAYLTNQNVLKLEILTKKEDGTGWVENSDGSPK